MCVCVFVCVFLAKLKENVAKLPLRLQLTAKLRVEPMTRSFCSCCYACCVVVACLPKQAAANGTLQQQQQLCLLFAFAIVVCVHLIMIFRCWPQNVGNTFFQLATYALAKHSGHAQWQQLYKKEVLLRYLCKYSTVDLHSGTKRTKNKFWVINTFSKSFSNQKAVPSIPRLPHCARAIRQRQLRHNATNKMWQMQQFVSRATFAISTQLTQNKEAEKKTI